MKSQALSPRPSQSKKAHGVSLQGPTPNPLPKRLPASGEGAILDSGVCNGGRSRHYTPQTPKMRRPWRYLEVKDPVSGKELETRVDS